MSGQALTGLGAEPLSRLLSSTPVGEPGVGVAVGVTVAVGGTGVSVGVAVGGAEVAVGVAVGAAPHDPVWMSSDQLLRLPPSRLASSEMVTSHSPLGSSPMRPLGCAPTWLPGC